MLDANVVSQKLAIDGGPKAVTNTLTDWPSFDENAIRAVEEVLRSGKVNYWTGPKGMEFEKQFAAWQGSKFAISTATGTAALHVCLAALGIGPGDEVIVPSYTFIATSFSVVQAGADPAVRRREPRRPLHQRRVGGETGHAAHQGDHPGASCTAMCATWTRSSPSPRSTTST